MPLTIAHPAAAVPLQRFGFVLSALIAGSVIPDFEFFLRLSSERMIAHTFAGIFIFCIPVGLALLFVFHRVVKFPLLSLLPQSHQMRLFPVACGFKFFPLKRFAMILLSLILGISSHHLMDAFAHGDGLIPDMLPFLRTVLFQVPYGSVRLYFLLQYVFTIVGTALLFVWYYRWYKSTPITKNVVAHEFALYRKLGVGFSMGTFTIGGGVGYGLFSIQHLQSTEMLKTFITHTTVATVTSFLISLITFGVLWYFLVPHHKRTRTHVAQDKEKAFPLVHAD